ncbi:related to integral membrane protein [Rhynchosporium agropyri]|uniref:Related to integral membrane protein n=1 Tax=Rhynchosporium agropyri TaxID=914238 RepID=A0A1E1JU15_9HELO|nr:related to integral membrane protein [Rhynchosporium agropyri]
MATDSSARGTNTIVTSIVFLLFATIAVIVRLIARISYLKNAGSDDVMIVISLITCTALVVLSCYEVKHGLGQHISENLYFAIILYNLSLASIKISIVLQYLRVFVGRTIRFWCWMTIALVLVYAFQAVLTSIFSCVPLGTFWKGGGKCIDKKFGWFFNATFNICTDLIILALPIPVLKSLQLPLKQKIGLMCVFALGGFVCLFSVLRLHSLYVSSNSHDSTYDDANIAIWSNIEVTTGIICASMPATKSLIARFFPNLLSTNHSRQPSVPTQGRSHNFRAASDDSTAPVQLMNVDGDHKTVTRVEAGKGRDIYGDGDLERASLDIVVTTSMTQDVQRKGQIGGEKDLVIRLN